MVVVAAVAAAAVVAYTLRSFLRLMDTQHICNAALFLFPSSWERYSFRGYQRTADGDTKIAENDETKTAQIKKGKNENRGAKGQIFYQICWEGGHIRPHHDTRSYRSFPLEGKGKAKMVKLRFHRSQAFEW